MGSLTDDFDAEPSSCSLLHLRPGGDRKNERFGSPPGGKKSVKSCLHLRFQCRALGHGACASSDALPLVNFDKLFFAYIASHWRSTSISSTLSIASNWRSSWA
eukprot:2928621-Amphidinium_carterae.1